MKKILNEKLVTIIFIIILISTSLLTIWLIASKEEDTDKTKLLIYTSFYPLYDFTKKVGGNKVNVVNLVQPGEESHHFKPSTSQMAKMYDANLIVINGLDMEGWIENLNPELVNKIVDTSNGVELLYKNYGEEEEEEEHNHGDIDPHIWLSIPNAIKQMENIKDALIDIDEANEDYYTKRFQEYEYLFNCVHQGNLNLLSNLENNTIVVSHKAFAYLANDYNLEQVSIGRIDSEEEPSANRIAEIMDYIEENNIGTIFYQTLVNSKVADVISKQTTTKLESLSTLEGLTLAEIASNDDYLSVMTRNILVIYKSLTS